MDIHKSSSLSTSPTKLDDIIDKNNKNYNNWQTFISEYCDSSTIHGVRYLGEFYRPKCERIFWILIFCVSFIGCSILVWEVWDKWQNHPVIISFDDESTSINSIPFPAITLCPGNQANRDLFNFSKIYDDFKENNKNISEIEKEQFEAFEEICPDEIFNELNLTKITLKHSIIEILKEVHPNFETIFDQCIWNGKKENCSECWIKTITKYGICYTFNSIGFWNILRDETMHSDYILENPRRLRIDWNPENGYGQMTSSKDIKYPKRVLSAGFEIGLSLELKGEIKDLDVLCGGLIPGLAMILHAPNEHPQSLKNFVRIPFKQETLLVIKPNIRRTSDKLKTYPPYKRQCYFSNEKYLRYFKVYTQGNCELECLGNYSLKMCNCIEFHLPRSKNIPVCRPYDRDCLKNVYRTMILNEIENGICNCLPSCMTITYDMEVTQTEINDEIDDVNATFLKGSVTMFFKEDQFWASVRSELYGVTEIIANCGGVLGLFMGVSALSVVELIYFASLRLLNYYCTKKDSTTEKTDL